MEGESAMTLQEGCRRNQTRHLIGVSALAVGALTVAFALLHDSGSGSVTLLGAKTARSSQRGRLQSLASMGTGLPVFVGLKNAPVTAQPKVFYRGRSEHHGQINIKIGENDAAQEDWKAAGIRGSALGSVGAPQIDHFIEEAAADCGSDPNCSCDFAGTPRKCLFHYCCGTIAHGLGQTRGDYTSSSPTGEQLVDAYQQQKHLETWQRICQPEQTYYDHKCASESVPEDDVRKH